MRGSSLDSRLAPAAFRSAQAVVLPQHPDEHRPEHSIPPAVDRVDGTRRIPKFGRIIWPDEGSRPRGEQTNDGRRRDTAGQLSWVRTPAQAQPTVTASDSNDVADRLDIRFATLSPESGDRSRITLTFWNDVPHSSFDPRKRSYRSRRAGQFVDIPQA